MKKLGCAVQEFTKSLNKLTDDTNKLPLITSYKSEVLEYAV